MSDSSRVRKIIWATGFFVMLSLTTKDIIPLLHEYKYNNYDSSISISNEGSTVIPNVTICVPYFSSEVDSVLARMSVSPKFLNRNESIRDYCYQCDAMRNNSWDLWNYVDMDNNTAIFEYVLNRMIKENYPTYNRTTSDWLQTPVDCLWIYFRRIFNRDLAVLLAADPRYTMNSVDEQQDGQELWFPIEIMEQLFEYITKSLPKMIAGGCTYKGADSNYTVSMNEIARLSSLAVVGQHFCFPIPQSTENSTNEVECWFNDQLNLWDYDTSPDLRFRLYASPVALYSKIGGNAPQKDLLHQTTVRSLRGDSPKDHVNFTYDIDYRLIARKSDKKCSDDEYSEICVVWKQVETSVRECGCIPFRYRYLVSDREIDSTNHTPTNLPYCNGEHYENCREILAATLQRAREECQYLCEYTLPNWRRDETAKQSGTRQSRQIPPTEFASVKRFRATIRVTKKPFIEFMLTEKFTPQQFLSQLGGIVNFYLGFSGLTAFALLVMSFDFGRRRFERRRVAAREKRATTYGDAVGFLKMVTTFHTLGLFAYSGANAEDTTSEEDQADAAAIEEMRKVIEELRKENSKILEMLKTTE